MQFLDSQQRRQQNCQPCQQISQQFTGALRVLATMAHLLAIVGYA
jgi:hypothetical protein